MTNEELKMCARCQIRWERDKAMEQLAEHHIPFMCIAEDVVEVVRCKDCKHSTEYSDKQVVCVWFDTLVFPSNFCSNGERKE